MSEVGAAELAFRVGVIPKAREREKPRPQETIPETLPAGSSGRELWGFMAGAIKKEKGEEGRSQVKLMGKNEEGAWQLTGFGEKTAERIFGGFEFLKTGDYQSGVEELKRLRKDLTSVVNFGLNFQSEIEASEFWAVIHELKSNDEAYLSENFKGATLEKVKLALRFKGCELLLDSVEENYLGEHLSKEKDKQEINLSEKRAPWWLYKELAQISQQEAEQGIYPTFYDAFEENLAKLGAYTEKLGQLGWREFLETSLDDEFTKFYGQRKLTQFELESSNSAFANLNQILGKREGLPSQVLGYQEAGSIAKWRNKIVKEVADKLGVKGEEGWYDRSDILRALQEAEYTFIPQEQPSGEQRRQEGESQAKYIARLYGAKDENLRQKIVGETLQKLGLEKTELKGVLPEEVVEALTDLESENGGKVLQAIKKVVRSKWFLYGMNCVRAASSIIPILAPIVATAQAAGFSPKEMANDFSDSLAGLAKEGGEKAKEVIKDLFTPATAHAAGTEDQEGHFVVRSYHEVAEYHHSSSTHAPAHTPAHPSVETSKFKMTPWLAKEHVKPVTEKSAPIHQEDIQAEMRALKQESRRTATMEHKVVEAKASEVSAPSHTTARLETSEEELKQEHFDQLKQTRAQALEAEKQAKAQVLEAEKEKSRISEEQLREQAPKPQISEPKEPKPSGVEILSIEVSWEKMMEEKGWEVITGNKFEKAVEGDPTIPANLKAAILNEVKLGKTIVGRQEGRWLCHDSAFFAALAGDNPEAFLERLVKEHGGQVPTFFEAEKMLDDVMAKAQGLDPGEKMEAFDTTVERLDISDFHQLRASIWAGDFEQGKTILVKMGELTPEQAGEVTSIAQIDQIGGQAFMDYLEKQLKEGKRPVLEFYSRPYKDGFASHAGSLEGIVGDYIVLTDGTLGGAVKKEFFEKNDAFAIGGLVARRIGSLIEIQSIRSNVLLAASG